MLVYAIGHFLRKRDKEDDQFSIESEIEMIKSVLKHVITVLYQDCNTIELKRKKNKINEDNLDVKWKLY